MDVPADKIAEVRDRVDIERVVGRSVRLTKRGKSLLGLCPFHSEKTPSFHVDAHKRLFHCFGCQAGGDVFEFVMRIEGIGFREALLLLAREVGVEIVETDDDPRAREERIRRLRMYEVNQIAADLYARALEEDRRAMVYLTDERGLSAETIAHFGLGFAPDWTYLVRQLERRRVDSKIALELGLLGTRPKDGSHYDRLRGRIVFPIVLPSSDIAGFGGRRADWVWGEGSGSEVAKYLNSPESAIYDKSSILYGLRQARDEIRRSKTAVLVEGYVDVIGVHQAGLPIAVAACGTALSPRHARALSRLTPEVVTLYDGDAAGQAAARKSAEILLREGIKVRVARLPEGEDPDTFARRVGPDGMRDLIQKAPSALDFFVAGAVAAAKGGGISGLANAVESVKPLLDAIRDPLERDVCIAATARRFGIDGAVLRRHLSGGARTIDPRGSLEPRGSPERAASSGGQTPTRKAAPVAPPSVVEMAILKMLLENPKPVHEALAQNDAHDAFLHPATRAAVHAALAAFAEGRPFDAPRALEAARASGALDDRGTEILRKTLMDALQDPLEVCVRRLLRNKNDITLRHLRQRLVEETDPDTQVQLMKEADRLTRIVASLT